MTRDAFPPHFAPPTRSACVILLAGGAGRRAAQTTSDKRPSKQFLPLAGRPLLLWSLLALANHQAVTSIIVVLPHDDLDQAAAWRDRLPPDVSLQVTSGGSERRQSALAGLRAWRASPNFDPHMAVLIHDAARPFVDDALVDRLLDGLETAAGAIPTLPVTDTLKRKGTVGLESGPARDALVSVQTPQAFRSEAILEAHELVETQVPDRMFTDDASILEYAGLASIAIDGDPDNIKITVATDWHRAQAILENKDGMTMEPRTGIGYDVHRLVPGDGVWLCGHFIAHTFRLDGHSDADVGLHALTDAILGTIGAGDIGSHFPPSDPQWKGAASDQFLQHAAQLVREAGGRITHVDVTLVAEQPKIGPHRDAMTAKVAALLVIDKARVSVKATTNERLGFAGREEGIAALATATIMVPAHD